ncbi:MAG: diguanylate cyclase [Wenzhouxiangella sp.]|nr:diguanylate cyclase [Wenzhouxiangella sp.]
MGLFPKGLKLRKSAWARALPWLAVACWTCIVGLSLYFNVRHTLDLEHDMALAQAEAVVEYNKISRLWNARHGGPYVPVDEVTQPNPYLEVDDRDFTAPNGVPMTKINPAYMSRQMSELAAGRGALTFRLTSLDLKNPHNAPNDMERKSLELFEQGWSDYEKIISDENGRHLFYMSEFEVEPACLTCHADQGYAVGDTRGGISVKVPLQDSPQINKPIMTHVALFLSGGILLGFAATRTRQTFDVLSNKATIDDLTKLPNRRSLLHHFGIEFSSARRHGHPLSVLVIDIDDFKRYNDHFGHRAGDQCLQQVASVLDQSLRRPSDLVGRYGGEEFLVVLSHQAADEAMQIAENLRTAVESQAIQAPAGVKSPVVTISIGVADLQPHDADPKALFDRADTAMYQAKTSGKNQVAADSPDTLH